MNLHLIDNFHCLIVEKKSSIDSPNFMCKAANSSQSALSCTHFDLAFLWYFLLIESRICLEASLQKIVFKIDLSIAWRYPSTSMLLIQLSTSLSLRHHQLVLLLQKRWLSNTLWTWEYSPSKCFNGHSDHQSEEWLVVQMVRRPSITHEHGRHAKWERGGWPFKLSTMPLLTSFLSKNGCLWRFWKLVCYIFNYIAKKNLSWVVLYIQLFFFK